MLAELATDEKGEEIIPEEIETRQEKAAALFDELCEAWDISPIELSALPTAEVQRALQSKRKAWKTVDFEAAMQSYLKTLEIPNG